MARWLRRAFAARSDPSTERHIDAAGPEVAERRSPTGDGVALLALRPERSDAAKSASAA